MSGLVDLRRPAGEAEPLPLRLDGCTRGGCPVDPILDFREIRLFAITNNPFAILGLDKGADKPPELPRVPLGKLLGQHDAESDQDLSVMAAELWNTTS